MCAKKRKEKEEKEYTQRFPAVGQLSCRTCKAVATSGQCLNTVVVVVQHDQHLTKFANICLLANGRQPRVASPQLPKSVLFVLLKPYVVFLLTAGTPQYLAVRLWASPALRAQSWPT